MFLRFDKEGMNMKKVYMSPEMEVLKCTMVEDVIMASIETTLPSQAVDPTDSSELPVLPGSPELHDDF